MPNPIPPPQTFQAGPPPTMAMVHSLLDLKRWIRAQGNLFASMVPIDAESRAQVMSTGIRFLTDLECDMDQGGPWNPSAPDFLAMLQWAELARREGQSAAVAVAVPMMVGLPDVVLAWVEVDAKAGTVAWRGPESLRRQTLTVDGIPGTVDQVTIPAVPGLDFDRMGMLRHG